MKRFTHCLPFVRGNHQPPVDSPQKEPVMQSFGIFLVVSMLLTTRSSGSDLRRHNAHVTTLAIRTWWHHQMETLSAILTLCAGNSPVTGEFPSHRPVTRSFDVFFDLHLNKRLSKQSRRWWFETPSRSLWRHCNGLPRTCMLFYRLYLQWTIVLSVVSVWRCRLTNTVRCRYNAVTFLPNPYKRHPIARPWVWSLIYILLLSSQCQWW